MSLTCLINGSSVDVQSISRPDRIDQHTELTITVLDSAGTAVFQKGNPISLSDSILGNLFTGYVSDSHVENLYPNTANRWTLTCVQQGDYLASKRTSDWLYNNQFGGTIVVDQIQRYGAAEGLLARAALRWDELQSDWASGTLTNVVATTNASNGNTGGGDLELAVVGSNIVATGEAASLTLGNGLSLSGYASSGYSYCNNYRQIWAGSQAIGSTSDYLQYDVWVSSTSPQYQMGVDFFCSDGSTLGQSTAVDQQGLFARSWQDTSGLSNDQWYTRKINMPSSLVGKTIAGFMLALEGDNAGQYQAYFRRISYTPNGGSTVVIFGDTSTLSMNVQLVNNGYSNVSLTQVQVSDKTGIVTHPAISIDPVKIIKDSQMVYSSVISSGCSGITETSIDNGASWQQIASGGSIPNLLAGMSVAGRSIQYRHTLTLGKDPTAVVSLNAPTVTVNSAYNATKSDVVTSYTSATNFSSGTLTDTKTVGSGATSGLTLNGFQRNWDNADFSNQTFYGSGSQSILNKQLLLTANASNNARSRLDFVGQWQNFVLECDVTYHTSWQTGVVYRTTGWNNTEDFAYAVMFAGSQITFGHGTNTSGAGTYTPIQNVNISLSDNTVHRLKIVVNGNSHQAYIDGALYITATDPTFTGSGYIGLRMFNGTGSAVTAPFDNFGICSALSGTWQSPSIDISPPGTYGNSVLMWDVDAIPNGCNISAQTSTNGGTTWQAATNGGAISGLTAGQSLAGVHLLIKMTLTASNADVVPILNGVSVWIMGQYSASGTRIAPALSLAAAGRAVSALINVNANLPANTALTAYTSIDNGATYQQTSLRGGAIIGITTQPDPIQDVFSANSSSNYVALNIGGTTGTWTWDTVNSRLVGTGGNVGTLLWATSLAAADNQAMADFDQADGSGLITNRNVPGDYAYYVQIWDASAASGTPNTVKLFRRSGGTSAQVGSTATIRFLRGSVRRFVLDVQAGAVTVSMDGTSLITYTDGSPLGSGQSGLVLSTLARVYSFRMLQYGQNVTALSVLLKLILSSLDPTATPQVLDSQVFVSSSDIGPGKLIPSADYRGTFLADNFNNLTQLSDYWYYFSGLNIIFQSRSAKPAPYVLSNTNDQIIAGQQIGDILLDGLGMDNGGPSYRNRQVMKNVDDGSGGTTIITRDNTGQFPGTISQAQMQAIENASGGNSSGIVDSVFDASGMSIADAIAKGDQLLQRYGSLGRTFTPKTLRSGLTPGMQLSLFAAQYKLQNVQMLITQIDVILSIAPGVSGGLLYAYKLTVTEATNLGTWIRLFTNALQPISSTTTSSKRRKRVATTILNLASTPYTASGNTADLPLGDFSYLDIDINVSAVSGTSPTLVFSWERKGTDGIYYPVWTSSTINTAGKTSINIGPGMEIAKDPGNYGHLKWTLGGTSPNFTFSGSLIAK